MYICECLKESSYASDSQSVANSKCVLVCMVCVCVCVRVWDNVLV